MLKSLMVSFIGAIIYTIGAGGLTLIARKLKEEHYEGFGFEIGTFIICFIWMNVFLYLSCEPFTILTAIMWMWIALILEIIFYFFFDCEEYISSRILGRIILCAISLIICLESNVMITQKLIYVNDMVETDIPYSVSSDEILAYTELKVSEDYVVDSPEMRRVNGENIAVYHIENSGSGIEYIPGYAIQKQNEQPQIVAKRIYFDTSFYNKKDALRTIRRKYPTVILGKHKFDVDDNYNPYEVYEYREHYFSTNGKDYGIIILNLMDGTSEKYPAAENKTPSWCDFETTYPR